MRFVRVVIRVRDAADVFPIAAIRLTAQSHALQYGASPGGLIFIVELFDHRGRAGHAGPFDAREIHAVGVHFTHLDRIARGIVAPHEHARQVIEFRDRALAIEQSVDAGGFVVAQAQASR